MNLKEIQKLADWLRVQGEQNPYSEAGVKVIFHAGRIARVEKLLIEKTKPTGSGGTNHDGRAGQR